MAQSTDRGLALALVTIAILAFPMLVGDMDGTQQSFTRLPTLVSLAQ